MAIEIAGDNCALHSHISVHVSDYHLDCFLLIGGSARISLSLPLSLYLPLLPSLRCLLGPSTTPCLPLSLPSLSSLPISLHPPFLIWTCEWSQR